MKTELTPEQLLEYSRVIWEFMGYKKIDTSLPENRYLGDGDHYKKDLHIICLQAEFPTDESWSMVIRAYSKFIMESGKLRRDSRQAGYAVSFQSGILRFDILGSFQALALLIGLFDEK